MQCKDVIAVTKTDLTHRDYGLKLRLKKPLVLRLKRILKTTVWTSLQKLVKTVSSIFRGLLPNSPNDSANGWIGTIPTILTPMKI